MWSKYFEYDAAVKNPFLQEIKKSLYFKLLAHFDDGGTNKVAYKSLHPLIEKHWSGTTGHLL